MKEKSMKKVQIKIAKKSDFEGINQVINEHNATCHDIFKPVPLSDPAEIDRNDKSIYFKAKVLKKIVGYLWMKSSDSFNHENAEAEVISVVKPHYKNCKIGTRLLDRAIQHTKSETRLKRLIAKIKKGNDPAIRLAENLGFRKLNEGTKLPDGSIGIDFGLDIR
jgi:L-amino acid N-acyltransferase YncA